MPRLHRSIIATLTVLASVRNAVAESCEEVWFVEGSFTGETFTCGERIVYLQTPQGGSKTEQEARIQASLEELKCADCWPWEKYRQDGETERSSKRGIAIENHRLTAETLSGLSQVISWGVTWDYKLQGTDGPDLSVWNMAGIDFVPLIWGAGTIPSAQADGLPDGTKALLGFNEPNFPNQANLDPETAAFHWKDVEKLAEENNISTIVSPSMNYHESMDPVEWLEQFLQHCDGCKVDAIGIHVFACYAAGLKYHLDRYRALGKPMWITEIACSDWNSPERLSAEGQMAYMREAIPLLEADEDVARYAWFSYFKDEWDHPIVDGANGDAGLVHPNGTLTPLGNLYNTFASGSNLTEINITEPENETDSTTAFTALSSTLMVSSTSSRTATTTVSLTTESTTGSSTGTYTGTSTASTTTISSVSATMTISSVSATTAISSVSATSSSTLKASETFSTTASVTSTTTRSTILSATSSTSLRTLTGTSTSSGVYGSASASATSSAAASSTGSVTASTSPSSTFTESVTSTTSGSKTVEIRSTTEGFSAESLSTKTTTPRESTTATLSAVPTHSTTHRSMTSTSTAGGEFTSTEAEYDDADEENTTNTTDGEIEVQSCQEAVDAWCQSDPSSASFLPLQHCADWRLHDAMCSSPSSANNAPQFAGTTELEKGSFPALFLLLTVLGAAMAGATVASLVHRQKCHCLPFCCGRRREEQEDLKRAISEKRLDGNFLPILCNKQIPTARVAPEPGLLLPMEAVARRVASSPHASEGVYEGSPVIGTLSRKAIGQEIAIGTPVGTTPASRAATLTALTEAMAKATAPEASLDEKEIAIQQVGRVLCSKAALNLPLALRQEAEIWHSRQEERLNLAKSMEAVLERAASLEESAGGEAAADPLRMLLSRAMVADKAELEALLREAARRATAFEDDLDRQRLNLQKRRPANQSLLTAADLMKQMTDLTQMQAQAANELAAVQDLKDRGAGEEWKTACVSLEDTRKQLVADCGALIEETKAALAANRTAKILSSDSEREAALAEAARRQALFQEELQKQRGKLQKRTKAKSAASTPLELGRLLEDEAVVEALEMDRDAAMKQCQELADAIAESHGETGEWRDLVEGWQIFNEDLVNLSSQNQDLREAMPEGSVWASAGAKAKLGQSDVSQEQLAMLAEAARRAAAFDEELQKQKQQIKKRRKGMQKHGGSQVTDPLDLCHTMADAEVLKGLARKQAEARAQCEAMASSGEEGMSEAWAQLAATWVQMEKDINKAEKEVSEAVKVAANESSGPLLQALGLEQGGAVPRDDESDSRRKALQEASRRIAVFDEELSKQRAAMVRRRAANPTGARVLGCALLDSEALKALADDCAKAQAECQAAAKEACADTDSEQWKDLLELWSRLQNDLGEEIEQAQAEAKASRAQEASEALAAAGLTTAVRQALKFETELAALRCQGAKVGARSELQRAQKLASVEKLRAEQAEGLEFCQAKFAAAGDSEEAPRVLECRNAWQELVELWQELGKDLESYAQELAALSKKPSFWQKVLDTSVSKAEQQTILAEAARCAARFDQEIERQRERLLHRKKAENVGDRMRVFGHAVELQALAADKEAAKSACERALQEAEESGKTEEVQGWKQVLDVYTALDEDLNVARKEVGAAGSFSEEPNTDVGRHMVQAIIRDQKKSAASCLKAVQHAVNTDRGPLEELMEAQAPCSVKSSGASTNRSRHSQAAARVQMWDVLDEAQGLLESIKDGDKQSNPQSLKQLGEEACKQLEEMSQSYSSPKEKPMMKEFGCQTVFRLGGMAWHANPAVQRLLEDLTKVSQGGLTSDGFLSDQLDAEVTKTFNAWRKDFMKRQEAMRTRARSRSSSQGRALEASSPVGLPPPAPTMSNDSHYAVKANPEAGAALSNSHKETPSALQNTQSLQHSSQVTTKAEGCHDDEECAVRKSPLSGKQVSSGRLPSSRLSYSGSRSLLPGSANSDTEEKAASRPRRRRSLSRDQSAEGTAMNASPRPSQPPTEPAQPAVPEAKREDSHHSQPEAPEGLPKDLLAQLERKLSGSQPLSEFSEEVQQCKAGRPPARSSGPWDVSLLVPPPGDALRSLSPASSVASSQSPGAPRRLDPIVRPRAPPLPSAGRLLLASQESPADSARSSPRSGF